jgi:hypothetical protein
MIDEKTNGRKSRETAPLNDFTSQLHFYTEPKNKRF